MITVSARLQAFRSRLQDRLAATSTEAPVIADESAALHALLNHADPDQAVMPKPTQLPATAFLNQALGTGSSQSEVALAQAIQALSLDLAWTYGYPPDPSRPDLGKKIAFANILGQGGLCPAPGLLVGLTLIAPHTLYPMHAHPAIELYLVISGTARWQAGDDAPRATRPGTLILHPSGIPHATQTAAEPVLAIYTWRGDLASPSVFLPDD